MTWQETRWGRIDQGRRELAVALGKDVSVEKLAELLDMAGPSLWGWKQGSRPKDASLEKLEQVFLGAGLMRYTRRYLEYGPEERVYVKPHPLKTPRELEKPAKVSRRKGNG